MRHIDNIEMETKLAFQYEGNMFAFTIEFNVSVHRATHILTVSHQHDFEQVLVSISPEDALVKLPDHVLGQIATSITIPSGQKAMQIPFSRRTYHQHGQYGMTPQDPTTIDKLLKVTTEKMALGPDKKPKDVYVCLCESTARELKSYVLHDRAPIESSSFQALPKWHCAEEA